MTSVTAPAAPTTNLAYFVYSDSNYVHDFASATYTQVPNCGYSKTDSWAWTLANDGASADVSALTATDGTDASNA